MDIKNYENKIILGNCLEIMKDIPDNAVDMTFADPPFNLGKKYNCYKDKKTKEEYLDWCNKWISEMVRITKPSGAIFVHNIPYWLVYFAGHLNKIAYFKHWISWYAMGKPKGKTLLPAHFGILYYTKSQFYKDFKFYNIRYPHPRCRLCKGFLKNYRDQDDFGPLLSDVWTDIHRVYHKKRRDEHPCQLPIPLLERLILMTTDEGDIVLDPFIGTGTTAVAAKRLGRKYIGIDIDPQYIKITEKNLERVQETKINDRYVSVYLGEIRTMREL